MYLPLALFGLVASSMAIPYERHRRDYGDSCPAPKPSTTTTSSTTIVSPTISSSISGTPSPTPIQYYPNLYRAGSELSRIDDGYAFVTGSFVVPDFSSRNLSEFSINIELLDKQHTLTCGLQFAVSSDGRQAQELFYGITPGNAIAIPEKVDIGDLLEMTCTYALAENTNKAECKIINHTSGLVSTPPALVVPDKKEKGFASSGWMLINFAHTGSSLPTFNSFEFTHTEARAVNGSKDYPSQGLFKKIVTADGKSDLIVPNLENGNLAIVSLQ